MNATTPEILATPVKKGELYYTVGPIPRRAYIMDDATGIPGYPVLGVVFNGLSGMDVFVYYTATGTTQNTPIFCNFALAEKSVYCAAFP